MLTIPCLIIMAVMASFCIYKLMYPPKTYTYRFDIVYEVHWPSGVKSYEHSYTANITHEEAGNGYYISNKKDLHTLNFTYKDGFLIESNAPLEVVKQTFTLVEKEA